MSVRSFDHVAIPMENVEAMLAFYRALGFRVDDRFAPRAWSLHLADQKINLHAPELWQNGRFTLRGPTAQPGCGDFCFVWDGSARALVDLLGAHAIEVIEGPVERDGGRNGGASVGISTYIRDPDGNLVEFIRYD